MKVDIGRGEVWVDVSGPADGVPVLLVAGGGGAAWSWDHTARALARTFADVRLCRFDQAGVGRSVAVPPPMSVADYARDCLCIGHEVLGQRFGVVGVSLGGAAALRIGADEPASVSWLVAGCTFAGLTTFAGPSSPPDAVSIPEGGPAHLLTLAGEVAGSFSPRFIEQSPDLFWDHVESVHATARHRQLDDSQVAQFLSHEMSGELGEVTMPVCVVCGDADRTFPLENSVHLARGLPDSTLVVVPGAGHALPYEAPDALASAVLGLVRPTT